MAEKGIFRRVRLLLDKASAKEVEQGTKEALDRGTDPKQPTRNLSQVEKGMDGIRKGAAKLAAAFGIAFGVRAIGRFLTSSVQAAHAIDASRRQLVATLKNEGIEWEGVERQVKATTRALWDSHRLTEGQVTPTLQLLIQATGDYELSLQNVGLAADLAAATGVDLARASRWTARILQGDMNVLRRYGIEIEEGADAVDVLREKLEGMALAAAPPTAALADAWSGLKEAIGFAVMEGSGANNQLGGLTATIRQATDALGDNQESIEEWGRIAGSTLDFLARFAMGYIWLADQIRKATQATAEWLALRGMEPDALAAFHGGRQGEAIARPIVESLMGDDDLEDFRAVMTVLRGQAEDLRAALLESPGDLGILRELASVEAQVAAVQEGANQLSRALDLRPPEGGGPRDAADDLETVEEWLDKAITKARGLGETIPDFDVRAAEIAAYTNAIGQLLDEGLTPMDDRVVTLAEHLRILTGEQNAAAAATRAQEEAEKAAKLALEDMARRTEEVGESMIRGFDPFFDGLRVGFGETADLMSAFVDGARGIGGAIVGAMTEGHAEMHQAKGVAMLAEGTWPPNPAALLASARHFAAAALFRALPGLVAGGGSFGGGRLAGAGAPNTPTSLGGQIGSEVHIYIDPLNPMNPVYQDNVHTAAGLGTQRNGATVKVHPRSRT